jgi:hypothetical protein
MSHMLIGRILSDCHRKLLKTRYISQCDIVVIIDYEEYYSFFQALATPHVAFGHLIFLPHSSYLLTSLNPFKHPSF